MGAGMPSNVMLTPLKEVGKEPVAGAVPSGARLEPYKVSNCPGATAETLASSAGSQIMVILPGAADLTPALTGPTVATAPFAPTAIPPPRGEGRFSSCTDENVAPS